MKIGVLELIEDETAKRIAHIIGDQSGMAQAIREVERRRGEGEKVHIWKAGAMILVGRNPRRNAELEVEHRAALRPLEEGPDGRRRARLRAKSPRTSTMTTETAAPTRIRSEAEKARIRQHYAGRPPPRPSARPASRPSAAALRREEDQGLGRGQEGRGKAAAKAKRIAAYYAGKAATAA